MNLLAWYFITILASDAAVLQGPYATRAACQEASLWILQHPRIVAVSECWERKSRP